MHGLVIQEKKMIKSIKASSDCLLLRLPFEFSRARGMCFASIVSGLHRSVCLTSGDLCSKRCVFHPSDASAALKRGESIYCHLYTKETHKVGWHDCFSAVLIIKGSLIHNS